MLLYIYPTATATYQTSEAAADGGNDLVGRS